MKKTLTATDILNSVEFELLQGTLRHDEVGAGLRRLRSYQNKARTALYDPAVGKAPSLDDVADLQLQLNEMMLTLIKTLDRRVDATRLETQRAAQLPQPLAVPQPAEPRQQARPRTPGGPSSLWHGLPQSHRWAPCSPVCRSKRLAAKRFGSRQMYRAVRVPLIGGLLTRLRGALHDLVLFYVQQLARQQTKVNQATSAQILYLAWQMEAQNEELRRLREERTAGSQD